MKICIPIGFGKTQFNINKAYVEYIAEAGLEPVVWTPHTSIALAVEMCDGLLLPGGIDLDPIYYGEDNFSSFSVDPIKDDFERTLFHAFRTKRKPVFGICRGFQLIIREYLEQHEDMNVELDFWTHVSYHRQNNEQQLDRNICQHFVDYIPNFLYGKGGSAIGHTAVNSMHHQCLVVDFDDFGLDKITKSGNFVLAAWTSRGLKEDKRKNGELHNPLVCEAFRITKWGGPILAVQWHPEELRDVALIQNFFLGRRKKRNEDADTSVKA
jgi:gamma-glutamyl-gamma-aminobutyrate hydrolase PuuD